MPKKEGLIIVHHAPNRLKVEIIHLGNEKWRIHYIETLDKDVPEAAFTNTITLMRQAGFNIRRKGNTLFYTREGPQDAVFGILLTELLALSKISDLTLGELIALAGKGAAQECLRNP